MADYLVDLDDIACFLELAIEDSTDDLSAVPRALGRDVTEGPTEIDTTGNE